VHYTVCDFLLDLFQNSVEAGASHIQLEVIEEADIIRIAIRDNGKGMDDATLKRVQDPFFTDGIKHSRRKVGLGIPFLLQALQQTGGEYTLESVPGKGTDFSFSFPAKHLDTPPIGDLPGMLLSSLCFDGDYEVLINRSNQHKGIEYKVSRSELREAVGDFTDAGSLILARQFLESQES
jgi:hypothetical protein